MAIEPIEVRRLGVSGFVEDIGKKAERLDWLIRHRRCVPQTYILPFKVYLAILDDPVRGWLDLQRALQRVLDGERRYAVRSSTNVEDELHQSFAGQFRSHLDVCGIPAVLEAIRSIYESLHAKSLVVYLKEAGIKRSDLLVAVVIQEMIHPVLSGVSFSRNPITGLDEVVVEAVRGCGDRLVQGGITPFRWIYAWGDWRERPEKDEIDIAIIQQIAEETEDLAQAYGQPVDLEWVYDGEHVHWVQLRPISGLHEISIYSNTISREFLPGLIKPLIWSVNVPLVNRAWVRLLTELIGPNDIRPEDLAKSFYYHAYFNMGVMGEIFERLGFPRKSLEYLMGLQTSGDRPAFQPSMRTLKHIPRVVRFLFKLWRYDVKLGGTLEELHDLHQILRAEDLQDSTEDDILAHVDSLYQSNLDIAYINILVTLLMSVYNAILRRQLRFTGFDLARLDLTYGMERLHEFDPNAHLHRLRAHFDSLDSTLQALVRQSPFSTLEALEGDAIADFRGGLHRFMDRFGHLSESGNDFSHVPWRENGDLVLKMVLEYSPPPEVDHKVQWENLSLGWVSRRMITPAYRRARRFQLRREEVSSCYTFGYGWFREYFLKLGERLVDRGQLEVREDIFYLYLEEIRQAVEKGEPAQSLDALVRARKQDIAACQDIALPDVIYGDKVVQLPISTLEGDKLTGVPTSRGYHRGPVKVIRSLDEFDRLQPGDVLVIPYSDVAWTPLFARAGAVVAEAGGMLSHSSIVAREYSIPCVVSVPRACKLPAGEDVIVDGYLGTITLVRERQTIQPA
jgi:phosphohistidine swiveling domain-containing protein